MRDAARRFLAACVPVPCLNGGGGGKIKQNPHSPKRAPALGDNRWSYKIPAIAALKGFLERFGNLAQTAC